ncbi:MAG: EamA family transporter [Desulfobacterales bacterium]|nr:EamA family transporter [Desulfobacterales bacterium]
MIQPEALTIAFGLGSAVAWGAGDFSGGFATKRHPVLDVLFISQLIGGGLLVGLALLLAEPFPSRADLTTGALAGLFGTLGLACLYRGLASGRMGLVAPLSAVVTALVPVVFAFFHEGAPGVLQFAGFGAALVAVWCLAASRAAGRIQRREILLSLAAGGGFGLFFIFIDQASRETILWPLAAARCASLTMIGAILTVRRRRLRASGPQLAIIALAGVLDMAGNAFFALAAQMGRLDVAAVLSSLYPLSTVLLARVLLNERLHRHQWAGVAAALAAMIMIAA